MGCMSRRVPVFTAACAEDCTYTALCFTELTRASDGASVAMDIESLDEEELRRLVLGLVLGLGLGLVLGLG